MEFQRSHQDSLLAVVTKVTKHALLNSLVQWFGMVLYFQLVTLSSEFKTLAQDISSTTWLSHNKNSHFELLKSTKKQDKKKNIFMSF